MQPHTQPAQALLRTLATDAERGLDPEQVAVRRAEHGPNALAEASPPPWWKLFAAQFASLVVWILIVAAVIAGALGEWADSVAILAIVLMNSLLGFFQEQRAERALEALQRMSSAQARVIRGGQPALVPATDLVPGDVLEIEAGARVPADARLLRAFELRTLEAALTGESVPVEKRADVALPEDTPLGDRRNVLFMGTVVAAGKATAVVTATGMKTELGHLAGLLRRQAPEPTPLQRRLAELGRVLLVVCGAIAAVIFTMAVVHGESVTASLLVAVSLAVAAVPEGLPAVVTIALALGLTRMARRNAIIRRLPSVETLGAVTVICSDKTGTLTRNEMTVRVLIAGGERYEVTGGGYAPVGEFRRDGVRATRPGDAPALARALEIGVRCNDAKVEPKPDGTWQVIGDPTEGALVVAARKGGIEAPSAEGLLYQIPFDSQRKLMSAAWRLPDGRTVLEVKGAPEMVLARCVAERVGDRVVPLAPERRTEIASQIAEMSSQALRVLALAWRDDPGPADGDRTERDLVFAGLVGMIDPPREEAREAIRRCRAAGIRPVMITGDHPDTALAIGRELGLAEPGARVLTGQALDALDDDALLAQVEGIAVYARVSAEHKLRVVRAWRRRGQVVAMTGDGVNDAPALKAADIGIAMGITGTDVTREAAAMVLADDNFASIVNAVEEGRGIFDNIRKVLLYLLACNAGEVLFMFAASLAGWPVPLVPVQLLWMNLVTDGLPAIALGMEPPEKDLMQRPPRPPGEPVVTWRRGLAMLGIGALIAAVASVTYRMTWAGQEANVASARTVAFCTMSYAQILVVFACRSERRILPSLGFASNPHLVGAALVSVLLQLSVVLLPFAHPVFETAEHLAAEWVWVFGAALVPVTVVELFKLSRGALRSGGSPRPRPRLAR